VQTQPLDGVRVIVTGGLKPGERAVVQGASLIAQIR
jgi:multidrug efflux pump subunit AcrA (membrane-fusion protein)